MAEVEHSIFFLPSKLTRVDGLSQYSYILPGTAKSVFFERELSI